MKLFKTYSMVAPPLCRIAVPLVVGPDSICFQTKRIQVPRALEVLLILEEVFIIDEERRIIAGRRKRLLTEGIEGETRGDRYRGTRVRSVRLANNSSTCPQLQPAPSTSPLRHPRFLRLRSTLTLFLLALALERRNQQSIVDRPGMGTTTSIVRPRTPVADCTGIARLPTAGLAARHAWVVAGIAKIALCSMGGDDFELGVYYRSTNRNRNQSGGACFL